MRLSLLPFQSEAATTIIDTLTSRAKAYDATRYDAHPTRTAFALTSVTGSGKTIIAASVIEAVLNGSTEYATQPINGLTVLWVSYDPTLCAQTKTVFATHADQINPTKLKVIDSESFNERKLKPGNVYFLSLPLLGSANRLTRVTDQRPQTFWDVLDATVRDRDTTLLVVVDEAHVGMGGAGKSKNTKNAASLLQGVIAGYEMSPGHAYPGAPLVWGISATPERFQRKIKQLIPESSGGDVVVKPADVQVSGLLKMSVDLYTPAESASMHLTMLGQGVDELVLSTRDWRSYCLGAGMTAEDVVVPLMIAQLPNREEGSSLARENDMIKEVVRAAKARIPGFNSKNIAHVIGDRGPITVGDITIDKIDPQLVQGRESVQILIAKDAISTGWDCPRAEVLVSMRHFSDTTAITQMLGRMVRTPLARPTGIDRLDRVSCWVPFFTPETTEHVIGVLTGTIDPESGEDKPALTVTLNPEKFSLGGIDHDAPVEVHQVSDADDAMNDDGGDGDDDDSAVLDDDETYSVDTSHVHDFATGAVSVGKPPGAPVDDSAVELHSDSCTESHTDSESVQPRVPIDEAVEAITALPAYSVPTSRVVPVRRLLDLATLLSSYNSPQDENACQRSIDLLVRKLKAEAQYHADAVAAARHEIVTSDQHLMRTSLDGTSVLKQSVSVKAGMDMIDYEFAASDRILSGVLKDVFTMTFREIVKNGGDPDTYQLKADLAAYARVPQIVAALDDEAMKEADRLLRSRADSIALMAPMVRDRFEQIRLTSRFPQPRSIVLSANKTYVSRVSSKSANKDVNAVRLPKHLYCDADGLWPVPASVAKNTWEMAVLQREVERSSVIAWYRNPSTANKDALSIAYRTSDESWRTFQPDFLFVERTHDGAKVTIVDPHWTADADGLARMQAFAEYVESHIEHLARVNPVTSIKNSGLLRLNLQHAEVREAVRRATSLTTLFIEHGEEYIIEN